MTTIQNQLPHTHGDKGPHTFWRDDLGECHNPYYGCWCCVCSGFVCGCPCHHPPSSRAESGSAAEGYLEDEYNPNDPHQGSHP